MVNNQYSFFNVSNFCVFINKFSGPLALKFATKSHLGDEITHLATVISRRRTYHVVLTSDVQVLRISESCGPRAVAVGAMPTTSLNGASRHHVNQQQRKPWCHHLYQAAGVVRFDLFTLLYANVTFNSKLISSRTGVKNNKIILIMK